ncbi:MAG: hypothetical protein KA175_09905, partial [Flavobacteriales bacterium]|nr:hypothetical protein [Flavobacteriales bacterium]
MRSHPFFLLGALVSSSFVRCQGSAAPEWAVALPAPIARHFASAPLERLIDLLHLDGTTIRFHVDAIQPFTLPQKTILVVDQ